MPFVRARIFSVLQSAYAQTILVDSLKNHPVIDGKFMDWKDVPETSVNLRPYDSLVVKTKTNNITLKAGTIEDKIYMYFEWIDDSPSYTHKPFVWGEGLGRYVQGLQRENRLAIQFEMDGDYTTNWSSGKEFRADMWHWKSSRSNPIGLIHDKHTSITTHPEMPAYIINSEDGKEIYIQRPSDAGDKLYQTKHYNRTNKQNALMPKYILNPGATGSVADVKAIGVWENGRWKLELSRKMDTGNGDDVVFTRGKQLKGGIAVFDNSADEDHVISETLLFQF